MKPPVLILFGPTASGKTALLERLFGVRGFFAGNTAAGAAIRETQILPPEGGKSPVEIISADSMQVYRGMDIGTAKPSIEERAKIPHHLIDIRNPDEQFNAGEFVRLAEEACFAARKRGALPVVSGGTGFYLKNLVLGLSEAPPSDPEIRRELGNELSRRGAAALMEELKEADPVSAKRIHINDEYRLLRALEVYRLSGRPLSSYASPWTENPAAEAGEEPVNTKFRFLLIGLRRNREELYRRINARTSAMFRAGLPGEVRRLFEAGYTPSDPGLKAIGYREFFVGSPGAFPENLGPWRLSEDLAGVEELVARNSRRYAKRQITFFASIPGVKWVDCGSDDETARETGRILEDFLYAR